MGRSQESFNKKEVRNKKEKKRKDKEKKRIARKETNKSSSLDDMIAFVDEHGNITDTPPDPTKREKVNAEDIQVSTPRGANTEFDPVRKGTVTYFNSSKGFGFITDQQTKESIFLHVNNMLEEIREGNLVSYEIEKGQKGPVAVQVKIVR
jgi:cold shock CspA family protein